MAYLQSPKITTFLVDGNWTLDPRTKIVEFYVWGGGGGGGSGRCGVSGSAGGGAGGGPGNFLLERFFASQLVASPYAITIGTGGTGGASVNAVTTNGNPGLTGNPTIIAGLINTGAGVVGSGNSGGGGTSTASSSLQNQVRIFCGSVSTAIGGSGNATTGNSGTGGLYVATSGGGGGCGYTTTTAKVGNAGGDITDGAGVALVAGGLAGDNAGNIGGNGNSPVSGLPITIGGTGGGGGGHDATTIAGSGGNGAVPAGGGGGGAGNLSSNASGAGGNGANGKVIIIEYF